MKSEIGLTSFQRLMDEGVLEIGDGYRAKNSELTGGGLIFLRAGHVNDTHIDFTGVERFGDSEPDRFGPKVSQVGDTIITTKGNSTGRTSFVTPDHPRFVYSPHLSYWRSKDARVLSPFFLRYWSESREFKSQLYGMSRSTDMAPYLSLTDQKRLRITLPSIQVQNRIGEILGPLDDKIELNRRMNATLEAMAQAIFKSWFVDFDPVRAKAAAKGEWEADHPGQSINTSAEGSAKMERAAMATIAGKTEEELDQLSESQRQSLAQCAALFPDSFQDSELGKIPAGWKVGHLQDHAEIEMGQSPKGESYNELGDGVPLVNGPVEFGGYFTKKSKWTTSPTKFAKAGDLIVCVRGSTTGRFVKSDGAYCIGRGVCSLRGKVSQSFVDQLFKSSITELLTFTTGSTFPNWSGQVLRQYSVVVPSQAVIECFEQTVCPLDTRQGVNQHQSDTLGQVRDTLLPKLLSGELSVSQVERAGR